MESVNRKLDRIRKEDTKKNDQNISDDRVGVEGLHKKEGVKDDISNNVNLEKSLYELSQVMTGGLKRWEKVIYPMMIAFIILAGYGFWLIFNVVKDMHNINTNMYVMTKAVVTMTNTMNQKMEKIDHQMSKINENMQVLPEMNNSLLKIKGTFDNMNGTILILNKEFTEMVLSIKQMNKAIYEMNHSVKSMDRSLGELDHNISRPMRNMNKMMPW